MKIFSLLLVAFPLYASAFDHDFAEPWLNRRQFPCSAACDWALSVTNCESSADITSCACEIYSQNAPGISSCLACEGVAISSEISFLSEVCGSSIATPATQAIISTVQPTTSITFPSNTPTLSPQTSATQTVPASTSSPSANCGSGSGSVFIISSQQDLQQLSGCNIFDGTIEANSGTQINEINLPANMNTITGGFIVNGATATKIEAQGLTNIGSGSSLAILNNANLNAASFPSLRTIGGDLDIENNAALQNINGFPQLQKVGGNVDLTGSFNDVSLPALQSVGGSVNIQTTSNTFTCPISNKLEMGAGFVCAGNISHPNPVVGTTNLPPGVAPKSGSEPFPFHGKGDSVEKY